MPAPIVVLIEDDPTLRVMYRRLFERFLNCTVLEASDGPEGLQLVAEKMPALVVLDVHLPTMSGVEVLAAMRKDEAIAEIPCVVITSESHRETIEQLVAGRVVDILLKPVVLTRDVPRLQKAFVRLGITA